MSTTFAMEDVWGANFNTSGEAWRETDGLRALLGLETRAQVARLAMGRSLGLEAVAGDTPDRLGKGIRGNILFEGRELPLWVGLLVTQACQDRTGRDVGLSDLQDLVRRHWHRGVELLLADWGEAGEDYARFVELLVTRRAALPDLEPEDDESEDAEVSTQTGPARPLHIELGTVIEDGRPFRWLINGVGYAPHVAIMGQAGSGKTRTLLAGLRQLREQTNAPIILLDLGKGDLAEDTTLAANLGAQVLRVPEDPIPLDMFYGSDRSDMAASDIVLGFRDSFKRVMQSKPGAKQLDHFREALKPLFAQSAAITLDRVRDQLRRHYETQGLNTDSVLATINDLTERTLFVPEQSPEQFFAQSRIIAFGSARETVRNLGAFLLLDALNAWLKRTGEAARDESGHRALRLILAIDEARPVLAAQHQALSDNIRLHRAKGLMVMLASQSPDDYEGAADDYLENIGLPVCFRTNAQSPKVLQAMFRSRVNFPALAVGHCITVRDQRAVEVEAF
jgi:DNA sulfur modification protein DndE